MKKDLMRFLGNLKKFSKTYLLPLLIHGDFENVNNENFDICSEAA